MSLLCTPQSGSSVQHVTEETLSQNQALGVKYFLMRSKHVRYWLSWQRNRGLPWKTTSRLTIDLTTSHIRSLPIATRMWAVICTSHHISAEFDILAIGCITTVYNKIDPWLMLGFFFLLDGFFPLWALCDRFPNVWSIVRVMCKYHMWFMRMFLSIAQREYISRRLCLKISAAH
jgi:hypothetical protein